MIMEKFKLGEVVGTPDALRAIEAASQKPEDFLKRHISGDWGHVSPADARVNELSLKNDERLLSSYKTSLGVEIWVITEWDRSVTTILLPENY